MTKKTINIIFDLILLLVFIVVLFSKKHYTEFKYPENTPENFNFIAKINSSDFIIDTYKNELTKGIEWDRDTVIYYKLKNSEKEKVYELIKSIDIINYPNYYVPKTHRVILPSDDYYFKCTFNNIECEIKWYENTDSEAVRANKLKSFLNVIFEKIQKDEKVKKLPKSNRFRM